MTQEVREKIEFQCTMNYKAYRRAMISARAILTVAVSGGLLGLCVFSVVLGVILSTSVLFLGVISVLVAYGEERTYTVYDTRIVFKRRGDYKRASVPIENIVRVKYKRAFYEKNLATGTITLYAKNVKGKLKKYKMKHIFDAAPVVEYIDNRIKQK